MARQQEAERALAARRAKEREEDLKFQRQQDMGRFGSRIYSGGTAQHMRVMVAGVGWVDKDGKAVEPVDAKPAAKPAATKLGAKAVPGSAPRPKVAKGPNTTSIANSMHTSSTACTSTTSSKRTSNTTSTTASTQPLKSTTITAASISTTTTTATLSFNSLSSTKPIDLTNDQAIDLTNDQESDVLRRHTLKAAIIHVE